MSSKKSIQLRQFLSTCPKSKMPKDFEPMSPTLIPEPFNHADWQFEIKWDGFRTLTYSEDKNVNLRSKNNHSFNRKFPAIKTELEGLGINAVLDGELVVLNEKGLADFNR